jgi:hypothetical protein
MHDRLDYYEADFADDDPRQELMWDADTDLRLLDLWQLVAEIGDVLDDAGREILAVCIRRAYERGYEDGGRGTSTAFLNTSGVIRGCGRTLSRARQTPADGESIERCRIGRETALNTVV